MTQEIRSITSPKEKTGLFIQSNEKVIISEDELNKQC